MKASIPRDEIVESAMKLGHSKGVREFEVLCVLSISLQQLFIMLLNSLKDYNFLFSMDGGHSSVRFGEKGRGLLALQVSLSPSKL